jgi:hypothetical protein
MYRICRQLMTAHADVYGQRLWYEAALLAGHVSEQEFLQQPTRYCAAQRLVLLGAVRADMAGDTMAALEGYRACLDTPKCRDSDLFCPPEWEARVKWIFESPSLWDFVGARLEALGGSRM